MFELWLSWRFVKNNIWAGAVAPTLFTLALCAANGLAGTEIAISTLASFIYAYLHLYVFDINSQIFGIEEDKINKPDRPLAAKIITLASAKIRAVIFTLLFFAYGICLGVIAGPCSGYCSSCCTAIRRGAITGC
ncbi:(S)-2,3-di-O-geranylgeranylglyceryl phosphate synthase [Serratia rubidaea]|uniref:(S)-2,3-di-O-geranylgeranylglyceryl phosphate synthase n=1 Tax=Serratia rubidaea TaxID=61652 RepID=A0A4U9HCA5_SERRU|nr:(S)-2,3-di-O-geranylgeranylglyceryl phosphate synthase [Serratia rubidaea]